MQTQVRAVDGDQLAESDKRGKVKGVTTAFRAQVDADDLASEGVGEDARRSSEPTTQIQDERVFSDMGEMRKFADKANSADMVLVGDFGGGIVREIVLCQIG
jgi:hypothetical protein